MSRAASLVLIGLLVLTVFVVLSVPDKPFSFPIPTTIELPKQKGSEFSKGEWYLYVQRDAQKWGWEGPINKGRPFTSYGECLAWGTELQIALYNVGIEAIIGCTTNPRYYKSVK